jgi:hypothetical protein
MLMLAWETNAQVTNFYYVNIANPTPVIPFQSWSDAATNIQDAVTQAEADLGAGTNCIVLVTDGVYTVSAPITLAAGITLRSVNGRSNTVVQADYPAITTRCFTILGPSVVDGFTISRGRAIGTNDAANPDVGRGGGVYMTNGWLLNSLVASNNAWMVTNWGQGCGIYMGGDAVVSNCVLAGNTGTFSRGGGAYIVDRARLTHSMIFSNYITTGVGAQGGGIHLDAGVVDSCHIGPANRGRHACGVQMTGGLMKDCVISNNFSGNGAGLMIFGGVVSNTLITHNTGATGGGVYYDRGGVLSGCRIVFNSGGTGAGAYMMRGTLRNCLVAYNTATGSGGGVYGANGVDARVESCTIVRNQAAGTGGGLYVDDADVLNTVVYHNDAPTDSNTFYTALEPFNYNSTAPLIAGDGNQDADPLFLDPGAGYGPTATLGNFRLRAESLCRNAGSNQAWMAAARDVSGLRRILPTGGTVDIGAYEFGVPGAMIRFR